MAHGRLTFATKLSKEDQYALMLWPYAYKIPIIPADTTNKTISLKQWPTMDFNNTDFKAEMFMGVYDKGAAIRLGPTLQEGVYSVALDFDGWDAVVAWFGSWDNVIAYSKKSLVEWHQDKGKIHVILFTQEPLPNKKIHIGENNVLLEIRCEKQILFVSPSPHKDGNKYNPIGIEYIETLQRTGLLQLKAKVNLFCDKYMSDEDKAKYDTWLDDPNTILGEGAGRHDATKFKICSYYWKYEGEWLNLSDDERFQRAWQWHEAQCKPPRSRQEFDQMCDWVKKNQRVKRDELHDRIRDERERLKEEQQQKQQLEQPQQSAIGSDRIAVSVQNELKNHKWSILSHDGPKFVIAHKGLNQTLEAAQFEEAMFNSDGTKYTQPYLQLRDVYINAIPIEITKYEDPINDGNVTLEQQYKITFKTTSGKTLTTPEPMSLDDIILFLNSKSLICSPLGAKGAVANIINAFEKAAEIKISREIETPGFFLVDGKVVASHIEIKNHTVEEIRGAALFLNELVKKFHRLDVISTSIHWGVMAPFNYVLKQYTEEMVWMQWLGCSGSTQVGKSTDGRVACGIWGYYNSVKYNIPFTSVNTKATLGKKLSQSSLPLNVQETDDLVSEEMRGMRDMVKGCVQGMISRSKYISRTTYADIPCLPACIFSSNQPFPEDPGYRSKFIYITYTAKDRFWTMEQQVEFNGFISKGLVHLKTVGDFVAKQILDNQSILLKENKEECNWKTTAITVLRSLYQTAGLEVPRWVGLFVSEVNTTSAAIEDAKESAYFQLVGMFQQGIIDGYRKDPKHSWDSEDKIYREVDFHDKLTHCLKEHLIPYLWERPGDSVNLRHIVITQEVMNEIKKRKIPNITSMQALADEIPNFSHGLIRVNGKMKRAVFGLYNHFEMFVKPDIEKIEMVD